MKPSWLTGCFLCFFSPSWHPVVLFVKGHICWPLAFVWCILFPDYFFMSKISSPDSAKSLGKKLLMIFDYKVVEMICFIKIPKVWYSSESPHFRSSHWAMVSLHWEEVARAQKYLSACPKNLWPKGFFGIFPKMTNLWLLKMDLGFGNGQESFGAWTKELFHD